MATNEREGTVHEEDDDNAQQHSPAFPGIMLHRDSFVEFLVSRNEVVSSARAAHRADNEDKQNASRKKRSGDKKRRRQRREKDLSENSLNKEITPARTTPRHRRRRKTDSAAKKSTAALTSNDKINQNSTPMRSRRRLIMSTSLAKTDLILGQQQEELSQRTLASERTNTLNEGRVMVEIRTAVMEVEALRKLVANDARETCVRSQASLVSSHLQPIAMHIATSFDAPEYSDYLCALGSDLLRVAIASDLPVLQRLRLFTEIQQQLSSSFARILILLQHQRQGTRTAFAR